MQTTIQAEQWVTVADVAEHLRTSQSWVHKEVAAGRMPAHRAGRGLRFRLSEIDAWVLRTELDR